VSASPDLAENALSYAETPPPAPGESTCIAPGVHWLRMPLPMDLDHINLWLLEHDGGFVLVDTGLASDAARSAWERLEGSLLRERPLKLIVVTHLHPDHAGLAAWLQSRHGVPVWTSRTTERQMRELFTPLADAQIARRRDFYRAQGVAELEFLGPSLAGERYRAAVSGVPNVAHHPPDGEETHWSGRTWRWLETNGHAAGHLCLHDRAGRVLITGDQVLPAISPNVSLNGWGADPDPLDSYLASLERLGSLDPDTLALPSHGRPFRGLPARALELRKHHQNHLELLLAACEAPHSPVELLKVLYRRELKGFHRVLALGETLAHLEYLARRDHLTRSTGQDGVVQYLRA
jgi:glyoxylase-like metal-dependent hydrolase (beta-lactamase superfamily II)